MYKPSPLKRPQTQMADAASIPAEAIRQAELQLVLDTLHAGKSMNYAPTDLSIAPLQTAIPAKRSDSIPPGNRPSYGNVSGLLAPGDVTLPANTLSHHAIYTAIFAAGAKAVFTCVFREGDIEKLGKCGQHVCQCDQLIAL